MAGTDFTPLYVHLSQQVRGQILGGEIAPGEAIPSEAQLMERCLLYTSPSPRD